MAEALEDLEELPIDGKDSHRTVVEGRRDAAVTVCREVGKSIVKRSSVVLFVDGLPGSGKTGFAERVVAKTIEREIVAPDKIAQIPLDYFIGTERGTPERERLANDPAFFAENYMRYGAAREAVSGALGLMARKRAGEIHLDNAYDRTQGGVFAPHDFDVSRRTKLLVVEGTGAINQVAGHNGIPRGITPISVFVHTSLKEALFRGTLRDVVNGRGDVTFEEIYLKRLWEYQHLVPWARESIRKATYVCVRYPEKTSFNASLLKMQGEIDDGRREARVSVRELFAGLDPEFLNMIFPGQVDQQLLDARMSN